MNGIVMNLCQSKIQNVKPFLQFCNPKYQNTNTVIQEISISPYLNGKI